MTQRMTGPQMAIVRESIKHLNLTNAVKVKMLDAIYEYCEETIRQEKQKCVDQK